VSEHALRIGEAAERAGVSADTLRYYERQGLLPRAARSNSGYRQYSPSIVERVRFVRNALRFGFSVKQIAAFLRSRDAGRPPCHDVRAAASRLLTEMDRHIDELIAARDEISKTIERWDQTLDVTPAGKPARLLEMIEERPRRAAKRIARRERVTRSG
jgi:DNA-binding transcriptional MerR regulator